MEEFANEGFEFTEEENDFFKKLTNTKNLETFFMKFSNDKDKNELHSGFSIWTENAIKELFYNPAAGPKHGYINPNDIYSIFKSGALEHLAFSAANKELFEFLEAIYELIKAEWANADEMTLKYLKCLLKNMSRLLSSYAMEYDDLTKKESKKILGSIITTVQSRTNLYKTKVLKEEEN